MVRLTEAALAQHYGRNGESQANLSTRKNHRADTTGRADKMESGGDRSARRARRSRPDLSSPVTRPAVKESLETPLNELPGPWAARIINTAETLQRSGVVSKTAFYSAMGISRNFGRRATSTKK